MLIVGQRLLLVLPRTLGTVNFLLAHVGHRLLLVIDAGVSLALLSETRGLRH